MLGSGCFPDEMGFAPGVWVTGHCHSERGGHVEDVHRLEQHPGMLAVAWGGERLCWVPYLAVPRLHRRDQGSARGIANPDRTIFYLWDTSHLFFCGFLKSPEE